MRTSGHVIGYAKTKKVSIPSKREGTCEHCTCRVKVSLILIVSIPSKREGTCELKSRILTIVGTIVSIPSKREGTCELKQVVESGIQQILFQFPPNGKAHAN